MVNFGLRGIQRHITDPSVLSAAIHADSFSVNTGVTVQPDQAEQIIKQGKSPAAEALAPVVTDEKLLMKLARDARKGVRLAVLGNPLLTQEHLDHIMVRSLKKDSDYEVSAPASRKMDPEHLLSVLKDYTGCKSNHSDGQIIYYDGLMSSGSSYGSGTNSLAEIVYSVCSHLKEGGVEYLRRLHEIGFQDYVFHTTKSVSGHYDRWYEPGMLSWMVPEMKKDLVPLLLDGLLREFNVVNLEDIKAVASVLNDTSVLSHEREIRYVRIQMSPKIDDETLRAIYDLGPYWRRLLQAAPRLPEDLQLKFVSELPTEQLETYRAELPPKAFHSWKVADDVHVEDYPELEDYNWQSPDVVNIIGDRWTERFLQRALSGAQANAADSRSVGQRLVELTTAVHPDERHRLSPKVLFLQSVAMPSYRHGGLVSQFGDIPLRDWLQGLLSDQPTNEKVADLVRLAASMGNVASLIETVASFRRVSLLLGEPLKVAGADALRSPAAAYLVFQHYLGNDPEAWTVALDLSNDWDEGLEDLATTTCAAVGAEFPTEIVDLADLEAEQEGTEDIESEDEVEEPAEEVDETPEMEDEPADDGDTTSDEDASDDADEETTEEDISSLDITTPVMCTLF